jgi:hypothetical protein
MTPLTVAHLMAAGTFFAVALMHAFIGTKRPGSKVHVLFALTSFGGGISALAEWAFYKAETIDTFNTAFKWANSVNAASFVALVWFLVACADSWKHRRWLPISITAIFVPAALANLLMPYGFLYTEISGNVRELENVIERAVIATPNDTLRLAEKFTKKKEDGDGDAYRGPLEKVQREYIQQILELVDWRIEGAGGAAELLKLYPNTLRFRLRKLGLVRPGTRA